MKNAYEDGVERFRQLLSSIPNKNKMLKFKWNLQPIVALQRYAALAKCY